MLSIVGAIGVMFVMGEARQDITLTKKHEIDAVVTIARTFGVKVGFESTGQESGGEAEFLLDLKLKGVTLDEALEALVAKAPAYGWELMEKGIVNVRPVSGANPLLDARISKLEFKDENLVGIEQLIRKAPEVTDALRSSGARIANLYVIVGQPPPEMQKGTITASFKDMTVREILNELLRRGNASSWSLLPYDSGQRIMLSLSH